MLSPAQRTCFNTRLAYIRVVLHKHPNMRRAQESDQNFLFVHFIQSSAHVTGRGQTHQFGSESSHMFVVTCFIYVIISLKCKIETHIKRRMSYFWTKHCICSWHKHSNKSHIYKIYKLKQLNSVWKQTFSFSFIKLISVLTK